MSVAFFPSPFSFYSSAFLLWFIRSFIRSFLPFLVWLAFHVNLSAFIPYLESF